MIKHFFALTTLVMSITPAIASNLSEGCESRVPSLREMCSSIIETKLIQPGSNLADYTPALRLDELQDAIIVDSFRPRSLDMLRLLPYATCVDLSSLFATSAEIGAEIGAASPQQIIDAIKSLGPLPKLRSLSLEGTTRKAEDYKAIVEAISAQTPNLIKLKLSNTNSDSIAAAIAKNCPELVWLEIRGCNEESFKELTSLFPKLMSLTLWNPSFNPVPPLCEFAESHSELVELSVIGVGVFQKEDLYKLASRLPKLKRLRLGGTGFDTVAAIELSKAGLNLTHLEFSSPTLGNEGVVALLNNCTSVTSLNINYCSIVDNEIIESIAKYGGTLTHLDLSRCSQINAESVNQLISGCPHLETLSLSGLALTAANLTGLVRIMPSTIRELNLGGGPQVTEAVLNELTVTKENTTLARFPHVTRLLLENSPDLTDAAVVNLSTRYFYLREFDFSGARNLTDASLIPLIKQNRNLTCINLEGCNITDETVLTIAKYCKKLTKLNLNTCSNVTDAGIRALADNCPELQEINLGDCDKISDESKTYLFQKCCWNFIIKEG